MSNRTLTAQLVFDITVDHLRAQGRRAVERDERTGSRGRCYYRTPDGLKCAVGVHILDSEYSAEMEGMATAYALMDGEMLPARLIPHVKLLHAMQLAHDGARFDCEVMPRLRNVGLAFGLSTDRCCDGAVQ